MTRPELIAVLESAYKALNEAMDPAVVYGLLSEHDKLDMRSAMYNVLSVLSAQRRDARQEVER